MHRLFFMRTLVKRLPLSVLNDFQINQANMKVRTAGVVDVVNANGSELTRTEAVTILNDIALFRAVAAGR